MYQSAIAKFDKKTEKFQMWTTPKEWDTDASQLGRTDDAINALRTSISQLRRRICAATPGVVV